MTWTKFAEKRPESAGLYEWRVPSKAVPGMVLIVAAKMRMRGAGYENVLSPEFDYWDGYSVHVQCDVEWRPTDLVPSEHQRTPIVLRIEGLDLSACSRCGKLPSIEARHIHDGIFVNPKPWNLNRWSFKCCVWGKTPDMNDPREIERIRRATRGKAAPELLDALRDLDARLRGCMKDPISTAEAYDTFYQDIVAKAIAKATGSAS